MENRQSCRDCQRAFRVGPWDTPEAKEAKKNGPPCGTCRPEVMIGNLDAFMTFQRCGDQWVYGPNNMKTAMSNSEIESTMRIIDVKDKLDCLDRVKYIAAKIIEVERRNAESR
jgi:hypothetical protein